MLDLLRLTRTFHGLTNHRITLKKLNPNKKKREKKINKRPIEKTKKQDEVRGRNIRVRILYCVFGYIALLHIYKINLIL